MTLSCTFPQFSLLSSIGYLLGIPQAVFCVSLNICYQNQGMFCLRRDVVVIRQFYLLAASKVDRGFTQKALSPGREAQPLLTYTLWLTNYMLSSLFSWLNISSWILVKFIWLQPSLQNIVLHFSIQQEQHLERLAQTLRPLSCPAHPLCAHCLVQVMAEQLFFFPSNMTLIEQRCMPGTLQCAVHVLYLYHQRGRQ